MAPIQPPQTSGNRNCGRSSSAPRRLIGALAAIGLVGAMTFAAQLKPNPAGLGTHVQLGLPPCTMPLFTGYPCPTCGMTTAIAHAARGELVAAAYVQPAGLVFYALLPVGLIYALRTALFGKPSIPAGLSAQAVIALALGVLLCGWIVKIVLGICVGRLPLGH